MTDTIDVECLRADEPVTPGSTTRVVTSGDGSTTTFRVTMPVAESFGDLTEASLSIDPVSPGATPGSCWVGDLRLCDGVLTATIEYDDPPPAGHMNLAWDIMHTEQTERYEVARHETAVDWFERDPEDELYWADNVPPVGVTRRVGRWRAGTVKTETAHDTVRDVGLAVGTYDLHYDVCVSLSGAEQRAAANPAAEAPMTVTIPHGAADVKGARVATDDPTVAIQRVSAGCDEIEVVLTRLGAVAAARGHVDLRIWAASGHPLTDPAQWDPFASALETSPVAETAAEIDDRDTMATFTLPDYVETETVTVTETETVDAPASRDADGTITKEAEIETTVERAVEVVADGCAFGACSHVHDGPLRVDDAVPVVAGRDDDGNVTAVSAWCAYCAESVFGEDVGEDSDHAFRYGDVETAAGASADASDRWRDHVVDAILSPLARWAAIVTMAAVTLVFVATPTASIPAWLAFGLLAVTWFWSFAAAVFADRR